MMKQFKNKLSIVFLCICILLQGMPLSVMAAEPEDAQVSITEDVLSDDVSLSNDIVGVLLDGSENLSSDDTENLPADDSENLSSDDMEGLLPEDSKDLSSDDTDYLPADDSKNLPSDNAEDALPDDSEDLSSDDAENLPTDDIKDMPLTDTEAVLSVSTEDIVWKEVKASLYQEGALSVETLTKSGVQTYSTSSDESQIEEAQQYIYEQLKARTTEINISKFNILMSDFNALYNGVINEHPDLYYINTCSYSGSSNYVSKITMTYTDKYDDEAFNRAVNQALSQVDSSMSDMEKAIVLHDYLIINCQYDTKMNHANRYSTYGALVEQIAVCQGYALTYKYLLNQVGIECLMVTSNSLNHAWNMVNLDGEYYQVDTTWDDPVNDRLGRARHFYMFVSDKAFLDASDRKHNANDWQIVKNGYTANVSATNTQYDTYFWNNVDAPFVIDEDSCYYINSSGKIVRGNLEGNVSNELKASLDTWKVWGDSGYWTGTYSGLFALNDKLYYNKTDGIYCINKAGTSDEKVYNVNTTEGYVYGSAFVYNCLENRYQINYVIATTPNFTGSESIYEAVIDGTEYPKPEIGPQAPVFKVNGASLKMEDGILVDPGTSISIEAEDDAQIYYSTDNSIPSSGGQLYTEPITIDIITTLKAIAYKNNLSSSVKTEIYIAAENELLLSKTEITLGIGREEQLAATKLPTTRTAADIVWKSSDDTVASVTLDGKVNALKEGTTTITATVADWQERTVTAECTITVTTQESGSNPDSGQEYTVTFLGFNGVIIKTETVKKGESATPPAAPKILGYEFVVWDGNYTNVTKDETVTAKYSLITYTITYELAGGINGNNPDTYTIESEDIKLKNAVGREGYTFAGWYDNSEYSGGSISVIPKGSTGNITLYAYWSFEKDLWMQWNDIEEGDSYIAEYTGSALKPAFTVYYGDTPLKAGTDYTVTYKNNTNAWQTNKKVKDLTDAEKAKAPTVSIKGKGNYSGTVTSIFQIIPKNIEEEDVEVYTIAVAYNGKVQKSVPKVIWGNKTLKNNKDFTVSYPNETNSGAYCEPNEYSILVNGTGNYSGQAKSSITIVATNSKDENAPRLMSKAKVAAIPAQEYTGRAVNLKGQELPVVKYGSKQLKEGTDYTLIYGDCVQIGTYPLVIKGKGQYVGEIHTTFKIKGLSASTMKVSGIENKPYDGAAKTQRPTITDKSGTPLRENVDYKISYENNVEVGTAKLILTGMGKYTGTVKKTFKITKLPIANTPDSPISNLNISFARGTANEQPYEKGGAKPKLQITYRYRDEQGITQNITLTEGVHYSLSYKNNTSVNPKAGKEPYILVNGKKNFSGSVKVSFQIVPADIATTNMTARDIQENTKAGKYYSTPVLTDTNGKKLVKGTDYETTFHYTNQYGVELTKEDNPTVGTVITVTVTGKGNYTETNQTTYRIYKAGTNISSAKVKVVNPIYYDGGPANLSKSDLEVTLNGKTLGINDYDIDSRSYVNNNKKGTAKVTIIGKGDYAGAKTISFTIKAQSMKWWE